MIFSKTHAIAFIVIFITLNLYFFQTNINAWSSYRFNLYNQSPAVQITNEHIEKPLVTLWDFSKPIDSSIQCVKSKVIHNTSTSLCIHNANDFISALFIRDGIFEEHLIWIFLRYLIDNPDWLVFDIGANVGLYTLFSASTGTKVLAVEPFYDNQIRLHKAALLSSTSDRITLITNALSDKRNQIAKLSKLDSNVGAQQLTPNQTFSLENKNSLHIDERKYFVHTILFDDIVEYMPLNKKNNKFKKAIMKIDIEAYEPYAFQHATKLFDQIEICVIFMEWEHIKQKSYLAKEREDLLNFFYVRGYAAYNGEELILRQNYISWPWDIIWRKKYC
jgi:FkbM family methyltransferase